MELAVTNLKKYYDGRAVLDGLSFTAPVGLTRIVGDSGIGKTTLLRILLGLERADGGTVAPQGLRWAAVFQEDRLLSQLDAEGNLRFALGTAYDSRKAAELLETLGLVDVGGKRVRDYSGGMQRRLARARAGLAPGGARARGAPLSGRGARAPGAALACILRAAEEKIVLLAAHEDLDISGGHTVQL